MIDFKKIINKGKHISGEEYGRFWEEFNKIKARKLEFLQTYDFIDKNEDYNNGNYKNFLVFLNDFYQNAYGGKDNIKRIHYIEYPLDNYLKMEYYTYIINNFYGQEIRVTKNRKLFPKKVYDFVMFENGNLFILDFGNNDAWKGAWHITDKESIKKLTVWYDSIFEAAEDFKTMMEPEKEIIEGIKKFISG